MDYYVNLFIHSILSKTWRWPSSWHVHLSGRFKNINTAFGLGMTVLVVMVIAIPSTT